MIVDAVAMYAVSPITSGTVSRSQARRLAATGRKVRHFHLSHVFWRDLPEWTESLPSCIVAVRAPFAVAFRTSDVPCRGRRSHQPAEWDPRGGWPSSAYPPTATSASKVAPAIAPSRGEGRRGRPWSDPRQASPCARQQNPKAQDQRCRNAAPSHETDLHNAQPMVATMNTA